uniref:Tail protein n=1 Tax=viral metagenome TaxID=1070528 RepID=A0A6M3LMB7_9ZZZZ
MRARVNQNDFNREKRRLDKLFAEVSQRAYVAANAAADEYVSTVKSGIGVTNSPVFAPYWQPLSEMWMAMKKDNKNKFWMETMGIYKAVGTKIITKTTKMIRVFGGILKSTDAAAFGRAQRNEYGIGLGPARPLFEPAKDVVSQMTGGGRRLKSNMRFKLAARSAIKRVYK